jgi:hypothetical protein
MRAAADSTRRQVIRRRIISLATIRPVTMRRRAADMLREIAIRIKVAGNIVGMPIMQERVGDMPQGVDPMLAQAPDVGRMRALDARAVREAAQERAEAEKQGVGTLRREPETSLCAVAERRTSAAMDRFVP